MLAPAVHLLAHRCTALQGNSKAELKHEIGVWGA
jgi:hypothetical protein